MKAADIRQFEQVLLHLISINRGRIEIEVLFRDRVVLTGLPALTADILMPGSIRPGGGRVA